MPHDEELLAAIRANPADDAPRLVYADWLEERGDPRGEFIRLQCELSRLGSSDQATSDRLGDREAQLFRAHSEDWRTEIPEWARKGCEFERGFVSHVQIWGPWRRHFGEHLSRTAPIVKITLQNVANEMAEFAAGPNVRHLEALAILDTRLKYDELQMLTHSRSATELLRTLQFMGQDLGDAGGLILSLAPGLRELRRLELVRCGIGHRGIDRLTVSEFIRSVTWLDLSDNDLADDCIWLLTQSEWVRPITRLHLNRNKFHFNGVCHLVESPHLVNLTHLELDENFIDDRGARLLIERFPNLQHLRVARKPLTLSGCLALQKAYGPGVHFGNAGEW
jgi:uncharacterized protein (TIGR02996 family)